MGAKFFHPQNLPLKLRGLAWYRHFECSWHNKSVLQPSWPCYFYRNLIKVRSSIGTCLTSSLPVLASKYVPCNCIFIMLFGFLAIILAAIKFLSQSWSPHRFILHFKHKVPFQIMKTWTSHGFEFTLNALALEANCSVCWVTAEVTRVSCYVPGALWLSFLHIITLL